MNQRKRGRHPIPTLDLILALLVQTYFNRPSRKALIRNESMDALFVRGKPPSPTTLRYAMRNEAITRWLYDALAMTSNCVRALETRFAIDSTYFKTPNFMIARMRRGDVQVVEVPKTAKLHIAIGVQTLMVVAASVSDGYDQDQNHFEKLLEQFSRRFRIDEVLADAGYDVPRFFEAVAACGGEALIDQKATTKPLGQPHHDEMVRLRRNDFDRWFDRYRYRTLVECANSIMKRTIKRVIRARLERSRTNELLLVCIVHNLARLIVARIEHGIEIPWADAEALDMMDAIREPLAA